MSDLYLARRGWGSVALRGLVGRCALGLRAGLEEWRAYGADSASARSSEVAGQERGHSGEWRSQEKQKKKADPSGNCGPRDDT